MMAVLSEGGVELDCVTMYFPIQKLKRDLLAGSRSLTTYPIICATYCTGFHSHNASHTGSRHWCGGAYLVGRPPICASSAALSPHVQAVVHPGPLPTVIWWSHSPALRQCRPVHFLWLVLQPGMDFQ